jgi:hypothetical protein
MISKIIKIKKFKLNLCYYKENIRKSKVEEKIDLNLYFYIHKLYIQIIYIQII